MSNIKISQLNNATTPLAGTEVVPIVQSGSTKKVSVSNIVAGKQDTLVSGTNIKTINGSSVLGSGNLVVGGSAISTLGIGTSGTNVTGTTANTITQSILIPANTLAANNSLDIIARFSKTGTAGSATNRMYINTSNSLTGATLIANLYTVAGGAAIISHQNQRTFFYDGTTLTSNSGTTANVTDIIQLTTSSYSFVLNSTIDYYLIFAIQLTNTADSSIINGYRILKYA